MRQAWHRDYQLGVLRTSHHHLGFDARNQRAGTNVVRFTDCRFQGHNVLHVFCEFGPGAVSPCGETE
jgi:hypothetical protein